MANLGLILGTLRSVAGGDTEIVITTTTTHWAYHLAALEPLADADLENGAGTPVRFNDPIRAVADATAVTVADTFGRLKTKTGWAEQTAPTRTQRISRDRHDHS